MLQCYNVTMLQSFVNLFSVFKYSHLNSYSLSPSFPSHLKDSHFPFSFERFLFSFSIWKISIFLFYFKDFHFPFPFERFPFVASSRSSSARLSGRISNWTQALIALIVQVHPRAYIWKRQIFTNFLIFTQVWKSLLLPATLWILLCYGQLNIFLILYWFPLLSTRFDLKLVYFYFLFFFRLNDCPKLSLQSQPHQVFET